ncbi:BAF_HP2_G0030080.mRNA.1.CDS.1 [Saccharomyces cerevisiae]|nr:BAF_HP2_G0030080.mRNA.1.CDS.1 [Saccharomyces cerevisiae]CAI6454715.1 BAF_HP2_G0030080.mRNA.1.CDS.1 [Saccharomyces cerevisiae]
MIKEFPREPDAKVVYTAATHEQCQGVLEECLTIVSMLHETPSLFIGQKRDAAASVVRRSGKYSTYCEKKIFNQWRNFNLSRSWCQDHKIQFKTMLRVRNIRNQLFRCSEKVKLVEKNDQASTDSKYSGLHKC